MLDLTQGKFDDIMPADFPEETIRQNPQLEQDAYYGHWTYEHEGEIFVVQGAGDCAASYSSFKKRDKMKAC